ncbi:MAG: hypothetical protein JJE04_00895 [Acidobacteriia bacterium]|nr:hypothetical protein [Terriglobia bacterium]
MLSPRRLQGLFLAVTLLFAAAVGWLGWNLLEQDRALVRQRRVEQLEAAADRVAGALYRRLEEFEEIAGGGPLPAGAVRLRARSGGSLEVLPPDGLLYYPVVPAARGAPARSVSLRTPAVSDEPGKARPNASSVAGDASGSIV